MAKKPALADQFSPYVHIDGIRDPKLATIPELSRFQQMAPGERVIKSYRIRVKRRRFRWMFFLPLLVLYIIPGLIYLVAHFLQSRGHTFLYVTSERIVLLELIEGPFIKSQVMLNFALANISGFRLRAKHGIKKFLALILMQEKKTMYLSILTKTWEGFETGALTAFRSQFEPGRDAVNLCSELDALVLDIKLGKRSA